MSDVFGFDELENIFACLNEARLNYTPVPEIMVEDGIISFFWAFVNKEVQVRLMPNLATVETQERYHVNNVLVEKVVVTEYVHYNSTVPNGEEIRQVFDIAMTRMLTDINALSKDDELF